MRDKYKGNRSVRESFFWKIPGDVPGYRSQPDPYQGERAARNQDYQLVPGSNLRPSRPGEGSDGNSYKWLALLLVLLLLGIGVVGYNYYGTDADTTLAAKPKVFEITLGKENQTAQSKVRVVTHVVVKGDTLWDIAEKYVKDPFRYPELAELSKIKNPDLIYPYDLVRIRIYE